MKYKTERSGDYVTIWSVKDGIGLQFIVGAMCQRDLASIVTKEGVANKLLRSARAFSKLEKVKGELIKYAASLYPIEFLKD